MGDNFWAVLRSQPLPEDVHRLLTATRRGAKLSRFAANASDLIKDLEAAESGFRFAAPDAQLIRSLARQMKVELSGSGAVIGFPDPEISEDFASLAVLASDTDERVQAAYDLLENLDNTLPEVGHRMEWEGEFSYGMAGLQGIRRALRALGVGYEGHDDPSYEYEPTFVFWRPGMEAEVERESDRAGAIVLSMNEWKRLRGEHSDPAQLVAAIEAFYHPEIEFGGAEL